MIRELAYLRVASPRHADRVVYATEVPGCRLAPRGADGSVCMSTPSSVLDDRTWVDSANDRPSLWGHELTEWGRNNPPGILNKAAEAAR